MCVLLVEDEPNIRMLVAELLADAGHHVVEFGTAAEAMAYADRPDNWLTTVLTDINMPGAMDGLDLAAHIRKVRPDARVIVSSGRYQALPSGMPDGISFLPKPWSAAALLQAIGDVQGASLTGPSRRMSSAAASGQQGCVRDRHPPGRRRAFAAPGLGLGDRLISAQPDTD